MPENQILLNTMRRHAASLFNSALSAVNAFEAIKKLCRYENHILSIDQKTFHLNQFNRVFIIGAGKASAHMAAAMEEILGKTITSGIISVKYGHTAPLEKIRLIEAGHPIPDANGEKAATQMLEIAEAATENDLIICLISGGGSALLPLPAPGITLQDKQETLKILLHCGAAIDEINTLRKHMSAIKGGWLTVKASPAALVTLIISDVVGNRLDVIASGPTTGDPSTFSDCVTIIERYHIQDQIPVSVLKHLKNGVAGAFPDTPAPDHPAFKTVLNVIAASNREALAAACEKACEYGYNPFILAENLEGDTRAAAHLHTDAAKNIQRFGRPVPAPACILSGGETTIVLKGNGKGGRNQEFALIAALDMHGENRMVILSGGTDGTDGPTDAAGAVVDTSTIAKARKIGLNPDKFLANNDSYHFFKKTGDLLMTGPTGTNVMDIRVVLVGR